MLSEKKTNPMLNKKDEIVRKKIFLKNSRMEEKSRIIPCTYWIFIAKKTGMFNSWLIFGVWAT